MLKVVAVAVVGAKGCSVSATTLPSGASHLADRRRPSCAPVLSTEAWIVSWGAKVPASPSTIRSASSDVPSSTETILKSPRSGGGACATADPSTSAASASVPPAAALPSALLDGPFWQATSTSANKLPANRRSQRDDGRGKLMFTGARSVCCRASASPEWRGKD